MKVRDRDGDGASLGAQPTMKSSLPGIDAGVPAPLRIILAEHNKPVRDAIGPILVSLGRSVAAEASGGEAIESASRGDSDLALLDCRMPELDVTEAASALSRPRADAHRPCIIGLPGGPEERESYPASCLVDLLVNTVRIADLIPVLRNRCHR